jgi:hypothetical protein
VLLLLIRGDELRLREDVTFHRPLDLGLGRRRGLDGESAVEGEQMFFP